MDREPAQKVDPAEEQRKKFLIEGEVWITNAGDQNHDFWKSNILSMPKLRDKFDQLFMTLQTENNGSSKKMQK